MNAYVVGFCVAILMAAAQVASASEHPNLDAKAIIDQQTSIRAEAQQGVGRYKGLEADKRDDLFVRQDRVMHALANVTRTTELPENKQIEVFNDLEAISAILNDAEDDRMVCERSKPVGSNRPKTVCRTVAQRRADRAAAAAQVEYRDQQCTKGSDGFCR